MKKKEDIIKNLQTQYDKIKNRLKEYGVDYQNVKITHGNFDIVFHCIDAPKDYKKFDKFLTSLEHDWSVKANLRGRIRVVSYPPIVLNGDEEPINFVDLAAKSQSKVQDSTLGEVRVASLPISPSQVRVR